MTIRGLRWYVIVLVFVATLINFIDRLTVSVLAPVIVADLKLSNQDFAAIATWFLVAYSASHALSGRLYDRIGVKRGFTLSITVWSLAAMAHAVARSAGALSVCRFVLGLGEAGNWPGAAKVVGTWFPVKERAFAMAIFNSGAALGSVFAPPIIVFLQLKFGWQATFLVTGSLGFLWLIAWLWIYQSPQEHRWIGETEKTLLAGNVPTAQPRSSWLTLLRFRQTWAILFGRVFTDPAWWFYLTWLPLYLNRVHGLDLKSIAWAAPIPYLAADAGSFFGGAASGWLMSRRWSVNRARKTVMVLGASMMAAALAVAGAKDASTAIFWISMVTFGFQAWVNNVQVLPADYFAQQDVGTVAGLSGLAAGIGSIIFTLGTGWAVDHFGYRPVLLVAGILPVIGTGIFLLLSGEIRSLVSPDLETSPRPATSLTGEPRE